MKKNQPTANHGTAFLYWNSIRGWLLGGFLFCAEMLDYTKCQRSVPDQDHHHHQYPPPAGERCSGRESHFLLLRRWKAQRIWKCSLTHNLLHSRTGKTLWWPGPLYSKPSPRRIFQNDFLHSHSVPAKMYLSFPFPTCLFARLSSSLSLYFPPVCKAVRSGVTPTKSGAFCERHLKLKVGSPSHLRMGIRKPW